MNIEIGQWYRFDYPEHFVTLPEYTKRRGMLVQVVRLLGPEENETGIPMYEVRAEDGFILSAWEDEITHQGGRK